MASAIDDDDLESEAQEAPPAFHGRRRSSAGTTNIISEADKHEDEALVRKAAAQQSRRLWSIVICGSVLIAFVALITLFTVKTLLAPEPEVPFTKVAPKTTATRAELNTSNVVSPANNSDAGLDAFVSEPDIQSGPIALSATDENRFCGTDDCKNLALFLNDLITPRRDTCGRLYDQVCSRWAQSHKRVVETRGHYSVDDAVLDVYQQEASRLLQDPSVPLADQRSFYADCVHGRLLTEEDIQDITNAMMLPDEERTPETFAKSVALMSQIGASPFFGISVEASNNSFSVNLRLEDAIRTQQFNVDASHYWGNYSEKLTSSSNIENVSRSDKMAFFSALEQFMCENIIEMSGLNMSCAVNVDIAVQTSLWYNWYTSNGRVLLEKSVASLLEDVPVRSKALQEKIGMRPAFRLIAASERERSIQCLRFIDRHDPTLMPHLITTYVEPSYQDAAQKTLTRLKATLNRNLPNAGAIKIAFTSPEVSSDDVFLKKHSSDMYDTKTDINVSRLINFLVSSTWKRWTGVLTPATPSLSATPTLSRDHSAVHVPPGVFNLTVVHDKWLQALTLARVGPRIFKAVFSLPHLSSELNKTRFSRCVSELLKFVYRVGGIHVSGDRKRPRLFAGFDIAYRDMSQNLDLEEMASFYLSLQAYRALVGEAVAVPGTELDSDSLFLLYYVFDNCQVEQRRKVNETAQVGPRYAHVLRYGRMPEDSTDGRRRRVESVAAMFGGLLPEQCQGISDLTTCEMESEKQF